MSRNPRTDDATRTDDARVGDHYRDTSALATRLSFHDRFSTNPLPWHRWVFDHPNLPGDSHILELGRGPATLWTQNRDFIPHTWHITLSDSSQEVLSKATRNITLDFTSTLIPNFTFMSADARSLPFGVGSFDAVVSNHVLYHIPDIERVFTEVERVLRPGGLFFAATNAENSMEEMERFCRRLNPRCSVGEESRAFSLENGAGQLNPRFGEVEVIRRENSLEVTEPGPLIEYLLSMMDVREEQKSILAGDFDGRVSELVREIEDEISREGNIRITKRVGMFVAKV